MARVSRRRLVAVVLVGLGVTVVGGRQAEAGLSAAAGGIVVVGGGGNGTDPAYTYQFELQFTGTLATGTTFDATNLVGVSSIPILNELPPTEPSGWSGWGDPSYSADTTIYNSGVAYPVSDVTWTYNGPAVTDSSSSPMTIGIFTVTTVFYLPANYAPGLLPTTITYSTNDGSGGAVGLEQGGIVTPEPSTLLAPAVVILGLPVVQLWRRRRARRARTAQGDAVS